MDLVTSVLSAFGPDRPEAVPDELGGSWQRVMAMWDSMPSPSAVEQRATS